jgi:hypothetical protein
MKCHNCKNPVSDNSAICEWCGADLIYQKSTNAQNHLTGLDAELIALLEEGESDDDLDSGIDDAVDKYQINTGVSDEYAVEYVKRLNFFRKNKFATEEAYQKYKKKVEREYEESLVSDKKLYKIGCIGGIFFIIVLVVFYIFNCQV